MCTRDNPIYLTYKQSEIEISVSEAQPDVWKTSLKVNGTEISQILLGRFGQRMDAITASYQCAKNVIEKGRI